MFSNNTNTKKCHLTPIEVSNVKINIPKKFLLKNYEDKYIIISLCSAVRKIQKSVIWHQWRCQMSKILFPKLFLFKNYPDKYTIISLCSAVIKIQKSVIWHQWRCQMSKKILSKNFSSKMIQIGILSSRHLQQ